MARSNGCRTETRRTLYGWRNGSTLQLLRGFECRNGLEHSHSRAKIRPEEKVQQGADRRLSDVSRRRCSGQRVAPYARSLTRQSLAGLETGE